MGNIFHKIISSIISPHPPRAGSTSSSYQITKKMEKIDNFLRIFSFILCLATIHAAANDYNIQKLKTIHSWKQLEFAYRNAATRQRDIDNKEFAVGRIIPLDVDVVYRHEGSKILVTIPRFQSGVPATLGVVSSQLTNNGDPIIMPYPNWRWNRLGDCDHLTSVFRIYVDECNRIWVLDTGKVLEEQICPPQLLVFNARTDQLLSRYKLPSSQVQQGSLFIAPIVDILSRENECIDTFVYIPDVTGFQLIVYDHKQKQSWNIQNKLFYPYPSYGTHSINGLSFDMMDGIFSAALSPPQANGDKFLYFHALASVTESWVSTSIIRNYTAFSSEPNANPMDFHTFNLTRTSQSSVETMNKDGILFFGMYHDTSLGCWNSVTHPNYGGNNLDTLVTSSEALQFMSGIKIRQPRHRAEELWTMTIPFAQYVNGVMNPNVTNFRILGGYVNELVRGSKCEVP